MKRTQSPAKESGPAAGKGFTAEERAAMKERAAELKSARRGPKADPESEVLAKIGQMPEADRVLAARVHEIVRSTAPQLAPRLWYGMPAYAKDGKVLCFFQSAQKFKSRYATLGFSDVAALDDGAVWPTAFALTRMSAAVDQRIGALVRQAAG
ncbi:iron chaperone [Streptomyces sp. NPDC058534]|uniref:iron chaperone n=1 Tax=Streptomyces sp. NPDC058534 TaxID=3346541 RepID=UPI00364ACC10